MSRKKIEGFNLTIHIDETDPTKVQFVYKNEKGAKLLNIDDVETFFEGNEKNDKFPFKTILENLNEEELAILRMGRIQKETHQKDLWAPLKTGLKLKQKYDKKKAQLKRKLKKLGSVSVAEIQEKNQNYKPPCLKCKRKVGNQFLLNSHKFQIICGDSETPCDYNYEFIKPKCIHIPSKIQELEKKIEEKNIQIIKLRLEILFKLSPENSVMEQFEKHMADLEKLKKKKKMYIKEINKNQRNEERERALLLEKQKLQQFISLYKQTETFNDKVQIYKNDILVLQEKIRNLSFQYTNVYPNEDIFELIQKKNTYSSEEYIFQ